MALVGLLLLAPHVPTTRADVSGDDHQVVSCMPLLLACGRLAAVSDGDPALRNPDACLLQGDWFNKLTTTLSGLFDHSTKSNAQESYAAAAETAEEAQQAHQRRLKFGVSCDA